MIGKGYTSAKKSDLCEVTVAVFISRVQPCDCKWESIMLSIKKDVAIYIFNLGNITNRRMIEYAVPQEYSIPLGESNLMQMSFIRSTEHTSTHAHVGPFLCGLWIPEGLLPPWGGNIFMFLLERQPWPRLPRLSGNETLWVEGRLLLCRWGGVKKGSGTVFSN